MLYKRINVAKPCLLNDINVFLNDSVQENRCFYIAKYQVTRVVVAIRMAHYTGTFTVQATSEITELPCWPAGPFGTPIRTTDKNIIYTQ